MSGPCGLILAELCMAAMNDCWTVDRHHVALVDLVFILTLTLN